MKRKKSRPKYKREISVFSLSSAQRNALWVSLDMLNFVQPSYVAESDLRISHALCDRLFSYQSANGFVQLELNPKEVFAASAALSFSVEYLNGIHAKFDTIPSNFSRLPIELSEYEPFVHNLNHLFSRCSSSLLITENTDAK